MYMSLARAYFTLFLSKGASIRSEIISLKTNIFLESYLRARGHELVLLKY